MNAPDLADVAYRDAKPRDVSTLLEFLQPFFQSRQILSRTEEELSTLARHGFLAVRPGDGGAAEQIVGFAAIEVYSLKLAEIQSLAVAPELQGRGIGRSLVTLCVDRARELGVFELMAITASEKLFRDVGFDYSLPNQKRAFFYQTRPDK